MAHFSAIFTILSATLALSSGAFFFGNYGGRSNTNNDNNDNTKFGSQNEVPGFNFIPYGNRENEKTPVPETEEPYPTTPKPIVEEPYNNVNNVLIPRCTQRKAHDVRAHPLDCAKFTICVGGSLITLACPEGAVFHELSGSCVPEGSYYDTCSRRQETQLTCPPGATYKKAHPKECAQYYHCGQPAQEYRWEDHLHECEYPMLYNEITNRCEHYTMVTCGVRREPYDPCDYKSQACLSAHCIPCDVRHPSCKGKPDGMNAWKGREGSPYYVVCASQRVVYKGMCSQTSGVQIFDKLTRVCKFM